MRFLLLAIATVALSGCGTIGSANLSSEGPSYIGRSAQTLFAEKGVPLRQITSPSGATIYVYEAHNLYGSTFCEASYYVRNQELPTLRSSVYECRQSGVVARR